MRYFVLIFFILTSLIYGEFTQTKSQNSQKIKIALLVSQSVVGRYAQSTYNVTLATLISTSYPFELVRYDINNESEESINAALISIQKDNIDAIMAPLTLNGAKNIIKIDNRLTTFIPTVHKRDIGSTPENYVFGAIDYEAQIEALRPYMNSTLAVFYDDSAVGRNLNNTTHKIATNAPKGSKSIAPYPIDTAGDNIVKYLAKPGAFSKRSVITHLPIVKTSMLASHLTFSGAKISNLLSTQINFDPTLISLTQYKDRRNMIVANSIIEQAPSIYETNALFNNDLTFDWINYTTSVGTDYLVSHLTNSTRSYTMRLIDSQVIYPVELMIPKEFGFEPKQ